MFTDVVAGVEGATDADLLAELGEVEERRRAEAAKEAVLLAELERRKVFAHDGHVTMWGLLRSMVGWSGSVEIAEAFAVCGTGAHAGIAGS